MVHLGGLASTARITFHLMARNPLLYPTETDHHPMIETDPRPMIEINHHVMTEGGEGRNESRK